MIRETLGFVRRNLVHLLIAPVLAITLVTFLHEAAHAVAVLAQGGTVTEFVFLPGPKNFGHVRYVFPQGAFYLDEPIALAPYVMWSCCAMLATVLAALPVRWPHAIGSTIFVWLYVVPLLDIAYQSALWLTGAPNDFRNGLGAPDVVAAAGIAMAALVAFALGWVVQRRLYRDDGLSAGSYVLLSGTCAAGIVALLMVLDLVRMVGILG